MRTVEEYPDDADGDKRRDEFGYRKAESVEQHDDPENAHGIHRAVLERAIFLYILDIARCEAAHDERAQAAAENDDRHRERERECAEHRIDGKDPVDYFQVQEF